jgi:hypothetical protein
LIEAPVLSTLANFNSSFVCKKKYQILLYLKIRSRVKPRKR